jgi:hypothetical protein|tara:strand:+ start:111 stop:305 length:195 start_codon:yes stop_codon:yes gene_type:complete
MSRNDTIYTHLIKKINEEIDVISYHLASGRAVNFEEYQRLVGKIEGFVSAKELLQEDEKKYIED